MIPAILAPLLAQGLGTLANATLVKGFSWLKEKTGIDLESAIPTSADIEKLRQFEFDHQEELIKLQLENDKLELAREQMYIADVQDARAMQMVALEQEDEFSKRFIYYFAIFWSVICSVYVFLITFTAIPEANVRFADTILGFLIGSVLGQIFGFFFGSSKSSHQKDAALAQVAMKPKEARDDSR